MIWYLSLWKRREFIVAPWPKIAFLGVDFLTLSDCIWKCQQVPKMSHTEKSENPQKQQGRGAAETRCYRVTLE